MKRYSLLLLIVLGAVLLASASYASILPFLNIFNFPNVNPFDEVQYAPFQMKQGFENKQTVWFICTDASDQQIACSTVQEGVFEDGLNYAPRLANLAGQVPIVFVVTGQTQPVFTALPGDPTYSGLWQIVFVTFKPGVVRHCVNNTQPFDPVTNPTGLPSSADATFVATNKAGLPIVVKYPVVAVGALGGPWFPAPAGRYRIPQGKVDVDDYTRTKILFLPFWNIYCQDPITHHVDIRQIVIPDACDPAGLPVNMQLVKLLKANNAPGLCLLNPADTQNFYWQLGPQPINQFPILHACPSDWVPACKNFNLDYTPVETVVVLQRNVPPLPQNAVITNEPVLLDFLSDGCLSFVRSSQVIDGTVIPEEMIKVLP